MTKNDRYIKKELKSLLVSITDEIDREDKASPIFDFISQNIKYIRSAEDFNTMAVCPAKRIIGAFVATQFRRDNYLAKSIYEDYDFFKRNLSELCSKMYGFTCCVDKARFLISSAVKWQETGKLPVFNWKQEYTFHYPNTGTPRQWMNFIDGLQGLLYGHNEKYLLSLNVLIQEHSKKVKPLKHAGKKRDVEL